MIVLKSAKHNRNINKYRYVSTRYILIGPKFKRPNALLLYLICKLSQFTFHCSCFLLHSSGLSPPVKYFTDRSKAVLLLWIICVVCLSCFRVCLLLPCGHLLGKGCPLGSCWWCLLYLRYFPMWYPGSGVVLDYIVSWSLQFFLLQSSKFPNEL